LEIDFYFFVKKGRYRVTKRQKEKKLPWRKEKKRITYKTNKRKKKLKNKTKIMKCNER